MEIAALIGLFSWGMNSDRLAWKHAGVILLLSCLFGGLGGLIAGGGEVPVSVAIIFTIAFELVLETIVFFVGFGIGRYRARKAGISNIEDTFG
ncbi:putative Co/Zn/Cd cation transporter (cation efflux family) [Sphingopyxis italica]|uniref:Putative Co/Zn/Cd cation transporter (Cation efflux family) n=1 Tax=Sphingopyxis italica TaxID=1129133 RepID=A0A7X5XMV6_9SPHN|nr:hypothetical protein [Sphingopyxis italica]NJB87985.1 putative Co/Zn/Cd cation transporter (cation efflux family) [Sphingopyxis italica]